MTGTQKSELRERGGRVDIQGRTFQADRTAGLKALRQPASLAASQNSKEADTAGEAGEVRSPR